MQNIVVASAKTADALLKAGFELIEQGFEMNGHRCFRFAVKPGQGVLLERILRGKSR